MFLFGVDPGLASLARLRVEVPLQGGLEKTAPAPLAVARKTTLFADRGLDVRSVHFVQIFSPVFILDGRLFSVVVSFLGRVIVYDFDHLVVRWISRVEAEAGLDPRGPSLLIWVNVRQAERFVNL